MHRCESSDSGSADHASRTTQPTPVPVGPTASPEQVMQVWGCWEDEIALYASLILGRHEAQWLQTQDKHTRWEYAKYRYDVHHYYQGEGPPPQAMWAAGILHMQTPAAIQWQHEQDLKDMRAEWSTDDD